MANVFEQEGSPTQDSSFREHLNRNWEAGNRKFAELEGKVQSLEDQVAKLSLAVFGDGATEIQKISSNQENHSQMAEEVKLD